MARRTVTDGIVLTIAGHNYGAAAYDRVDEARHLSTRFAFFYAGSTLLFLLPTAKFISSWFSSEATVIRLSALYLFVGALGHAGIHLSMWLSQLLNVIGKPRPVMLINFARVFLFIIPLSLLGSRAFGFIGLIGGIALGNLLSGALAFFIARRELRRSDSQSRKKPA